MIINNPIVREFYPQSESFSVSFGGTFSDLTASSTFGVSGASGFCGVYLKNGKVYDWENRFVSTYPKNEFFSVDLNINQTKYDLYVNQNPVIFGGTKFSGNSLNLVINPGLEIDDFTYTLKGKIPDYSVSNNILFNTLVTGITGYIVNHDSETIKIYSGTFDGDDSTFEINWSPYTLNSNQTGTFVFQINQTGLDGLYTLDNTLYTNFGNISLPIVVSGYTIDQSPYQIFLFGPDQVLENTEENYFGEFFSTKEVFNVVPILQHIQGSGNTYLDISVSGNYTGNFTGYLSESGYLHSNILITGSGIGGGFNLLTSGSISGAESLFAWATGYTTGILNIVGYGNIYNYNLVTDDGGYLVDQSGNIFGLYTILDSESIRVSGLLSIPYSGTIQNGSGSLLVNGNFSGLVNNVYAIDPIRTTISTGAIYYNTPLNNVTSDILYINDSNFGIVYGFHYNSIDELASYINLNTGRHLVTGFKTNSNTIKLGSLPYYSEYPIILKTDIDNDGNMTVSNTGMIGGLLSGVGDLIVEPTILSGYFSGKFLNSGVYSKTGSGTIYGTAPVLDTIRKFEDIWNLASGLDFYSMVDYNSNNFYGPSGFKSPYSLSTAFLNALYLNVSYQNYDSRKVDVARLVLSGVGNATGSYAEIYITGVPF